MFGMSFVYVVFEEGTDIYWARSRVLEYLSGLRGKLPEGVDPTLGPDATGIGWVFQYALVDKTGKHGLDELRTFQDFTLRYALGSVPGRRRGRERRRLPEAVPGHRRSRRLRAYGVTLSEVIDAIRQSNNDVGGRILEMSGREYYVRGRGYITSLADIENVAVRARGAGGTPVLVRDVGPCASAPTSAAGSARVERRGRGGRRHRRHALRRERARRHRPREEEDRRAEARASPRASR